MGKPAVLLKENTLYWQPRLTQKVRNSETLVEVYLSPRGSLHPPKKSEFSSAEDHVSPPSPVPTSHRLCTLLCGVCGAYGPRPVRSSVVHACLSGPCCTRGLKKGLMHYGHIYGHYRPYYQPSTLSFQKKNTHTLTLVFS